MFSVYDTSYKKSMIVEICGHIGYKMIYYPNSIYISLLYMKEIQCKVYKEIEYILQI